MCIRDRAGGYRENSAYDFDDQGLGCEQLGHVQAVQIAHHEGYACSSGCGRYEDRQEGGYERTSKAGYEVERDVAPCGQILHG
eukprot:5330056-Pyramimonas_sp.AAC.1